MLIYYSIFGGRVAKPRLLLHDMNTMFKRFFDICFALLMILISSPVWLAIAVAVRLGSKGPILFRQERIGWHGRRFVAYKFRTLYRTDLDQAARPDDPNVTGVGRFIRRTHLDELPQFLNVLKGDMTIVGPRAERPVDGKPAELLSVQPGITGPAQLMKKPNCREDFEDNHAAEMKYFLHRRTFGGDLKIVWQTITKIFKANSF